MYQDLILRITRTLSENKLPYILIGGQAILLHGEPRMTQDIDISLGIDIDEFEKLLPLLSQIGLIALVEDVNSFIEQTRILPLKDATTGIRVDLIFTFIGYERLAIERAVNFAMKEDQVKVASKEDITIMKIVSGRARDLDDVAGVILRNRNLDESYILKWLKEFSAILEKDFCKTYEELKRAVGK